MRNPEPSGSTRYYSKFCVWFSKVVLRAAAISTMNMLETQAHPDVPLQKFWGWS